MKEYEPNKIRSRPFRFISLPILITFLFIFYWFMLTPLLYVLVLRKLDLEPKWGIWVVLLVVFLALLVALVLFWRCKRKGGSNESVATRQAEFSTLLRESKYEYEKKCDLRNFVKHREDVADGERCDLREDGFCARESFNSEVSERGIEQNPNPDESSKKTNRNSEILNQGNEYNPNQDESSKKINRNSEILNRGNENNPNPDESSKKTNRNSEISNRGIEYNPNPDESSKKTNRNSEIGRNRNSDDKNTSLVEEIMSDTNFPKTKAIIVNEKLKSDENKRKSNGDDKNKKHKLENKKENDFDNRRSRRGSESKFDSGKSESKMNGDKVKKVKIEKKFKINESKPNIDEIDKRVKIEGCKVAESDSNRNTDEIKKVKIEKKIKVVESDLKHNADKIKKVKIEKIKVGEKGSECEGKKCEVEESKSQPDNFCSENKFKTKEEFNINKNADFKCNTDVFNKSNVKLRPKTLHIDTDFVGVEKRLSSPLSPREIFFRDLIESANQQRKSEVENFLENERRNYDAEPRKSAEFFIMTVDPRRSCTAEAFIYVDGEKQESVLEIRDCDDVFLDD